MWTKPYGKNGPQVSVVGFGGMRFANPADLDASAGTIIHAHGKGINYFDTAPFYCGDKSEEIFGRGLKTLPRDSYYVSTKCMAANGDELRQSLERSLQRLCVERIDFFHIWCLMRPDELAGRIAGGAVSAAMKAKEEGLIGRLVVSTHLQGRQIASVLESGYFQGVTLGYNALNFPYRADGVAAAGRLGLGVVTMNPLGGGVIARNPDRFAFLKAPGDRSVAEAAIRFNVSHPDITVTLVGFANNAEVDQAIAAVEEFHHYPPEHLEGIKAHINSGFDVFCTGCGYCLPCPANVSIPKFMDAWNHKIFNGEDKAILDRLKWHWALPAAEAGVCTQCGQCEENCTQHLDIRARLETIAALGQQK